MDFRSDKRSGSDKKKVSVPDLFIRLYICKKLLQMVPSI